MRKAADMIPVRLLDAYDALLRLLRPRRTAEWRRLRPYVREIGFRWSKDFQRRHGVDRLSTMTLAQLATLRAELAAEYEELD